MFTPNYINAISGVDNQKYYETKCDAKAVEEICKTNEETEYDKREAVYDANRPALAHQIRQFKGVL